MCLVWVKPGDVQVLLLALYSRIILDSTWHSLWEDTDQTQVGNVKASTLPSVLHSGSCSALIIPFLEVHIRGWCQIESSSIACKESTYVTLRVFFIIATVCFGFVKLC